MRLLIIIVILVLAQPIKACFIACLRDSSSVLVANHEDWFENNAAIRIIPPAENRYGSVIMTFADEGWAQGGMNEKGLFFDAAHTPYMSVNFDSSTTSPESYLWQDVLDNCKNVSEAIEFIQNFRIVELEEAHIFLADSSGNAVIVGVNNNEIAFKRIQDKALVQTNFNPWHPEAEENKPFYRYETARQLIDSMKSVNKNVVETMLKATHQDELTVYSNIYDLRSKEIITYYQRNFNRPISINLFELFKRGDCMLLMTELMNEPYTNVACVSMENRSVAISGTVTDGKTGKGLPFANIGFFDQNLGTVSGADGFFRLEVPSEMMNDKICFSLIGYQEICLPADEFDGKIALLEQIRVLDEVRISAKKEKTRKDRIGWVKGREGIVPFDTVAGGSAVAMLIQVGSNPIIIEEVQLRLQYNSKDTTKFRLHFYDYDSLTGKPGEELLTRQITLEEDRRFGWMKWDVSHEQIVIDRNRCFIGFEWLDNPSTLTDFKHGMEAWNRWKKRQYILGNAKVEYIPSNGGNREGSYKYHGNMMNWPGFDKLPPWTGLMIEQGKDEKTERFFTYQRRMSYGDWHEVNGTLNAVLVFRY